MVAQDGGKVVLIACLLIKLNTIKGKFFRLLNYDKMYSLYNYVFSIIRRVEKQGQHKIKFSRKRESDFSFCKVVLCLSFCPVMH